MSEIEKKLQARISFFTSESTSQTKLSKHKSEAKSELHDFDEI